MTDSHPDTFVRRDFWAFAAIAATAVALRLAFAWQYTRHPLGQFPWVDEASYWNWACAIRAGQWLPVAPFFQDPLYPYFLAGLMIPCGTDVPTLRLASAVLGGLAPLVVAATGCRFVGRAEGLLAGVFLAVYGPLVLLDGSLEKEGLATLGMAVALAASAWWSRAPRGVAGCAAAVAGLTWGGVALLRSNALLIAPLAIAWWLVAARRDPTRPTLLSRIGPGVAFAAGFVAVVGPVIGVNYAVSRPHEVLGTTWQLGPNFYIGNNPGATGRYAAPLFVRANPAFEAADFGAEASRRSGRRLTPGEVSRYWLALGLGRWVREPVASARLLGRKVLMVTSGREIPDSEDPVLITAVAAPSLGWGVLGFGFLFPLALVSLARRGAGPFLHLTQLVTALGLLSTAIFFVVGRYRVPWASGMALLAATGLMELIRSARDRRFFGLAGRVGLLLIPGLALACWPDAGPPPQAWQSNLIALGVAYLRVGNIDATIDTFDDARALGLDSAAGIRRLCGSEAVRSSFGRALERLDGEAALDPSGAVAVARRARVLRQLPDRSGETLTLLGRALRDHPDDPGLRRELGLAIIGRATTPAGFLDGLGQLEAARGRDHRAAIAVALATRTATSLPPLADSMEVPDQRERLKVARLIIADAAG